MQRKAGTGGIFKCKDMGCVSQHNSNNYCLRRSQRVPEQLRTRFAWSSAQLNVLWQHLVEQGKNYTALWLALLLHLLLLSQLRLFKTQFAAEWGRENHQRPRLWASIKPCTTLTSTVYHFNFTEQKTNTLVQSRVVFVCVLCAC